MFNLHFMVFAHDSVNGSAAAPSAAPSDMQLVEACLAGDEQAWELLLERYGRLIYTIALRFKFSPQIADEVFQEVCLILLEKLYTLQKRERLHAWIVTVTRRACIQRLRSTNPSVVPLHELSDTGPGEEETVDEQLVLSEQQHALYQAMINLNERCRFLLHALFFAEERPSYAEIAETLDVPVGSVGPIRARCLEKLRQEMVKFENR